MFEDRPENGGPVAELAGLVVLAGLIVILRCGPAFGDLGAHDVLDVGFGEPAPFGLPCAQTCYGAGDMQAGGRGGRLAGGYGGSVVDGPEG